VLPKIPTTTFAEACTGPSVAPPWLGADAGDQAEQDSRDYVVGRWVACPPVDQAPTWPGGAIEFGANGRWHLLSVDANGVFGSTYDVGTYWLLGSGQLNVRDDENGFIISTYFLNFVGPDAVVLSYSDFSGARYARVNPSPANGSDNAPSVTDEWSPMCTMVGTWDVPATDGAPAATFAFDDQGNFVAGPAGSDLCSGHTMSGTYRLTSQAFQLTTSVGLGCKWWFDAGYWPDFAADCSTLTLSHVEWDNCMGGRTYFNMPTTMSRR
jgi:hypothetical protein